LLAGFESIGNKYAELKHLFDFEVLDYVANQYELELELSQLSEMANFT